MSRKAMQMALEALEDANDVARMEFSDEDYYSEAINALSQALETEQEPVAWRYKYPDGFWRFSNGERVNGSDPIKSQALYTSPPKREITCVCGAVWEGETMVHPPREREWVGLTANEVYECWMSGDVVAAVEAKLKEKNKW